MVVVDVLDVVLVEVDVEEPVLVEVFVEALVLVVVSVKDDVEAEVAVDVVEAVAELLLVDELVLVSVTVLDELKVAVDELVAVELDVVLVVHLPHMTGQRLCALSLCPARVQCSSRSVAPQFWFSGTPWQLDGRYLVVVVVVLVHASHKRGHFTRAFSLWPSR